MAWEITGNSAINPAANFLGTIDNQPLIIRTNSAERFRLDTNGNVGIGTSTPHTKLEIKSGFDTEVLRFGYSDQDYHSITTSFNGDFPPNNYLRFNVEHTSGDIRGVLTLQGDGTVYTGGPLHINRTNDEINISQASLTVENPGGHQSMQYFTFSGIEKSSIRADSTGNLVFNASTSRYYLSRDFGDPAAITIVPRNSGGTLIIDGAVKVSALLFRDGSMLKTATSQGPAGVEGKGGRKARTAQLGALEIKDLLECAPKQLLSVVFIRALKFAVVVLLLSRFGLALLLLIQAVVEMNRRDIAVYAIFDGCCRP